MSNSVWIKGYEGKYKIYDDGRVQSFCKGGAKFRKASDNGHGYLVVAFRKDGKTKTVSVHAMVAKHFVPGWKPGLQVNHKNCIKTDNRAENLEWVTVQENLRHARVNGLAKLLEKPVNAVHVETGEKIKFKSVADGARFVGSGRSDICKCCKGEYKTVRGYRWSYAAIAKAGVV